jgi:HEAT repeat protein
MRVTMMMHYGESVAYHQAIMRHGGGATRVRQRYEAFTLVEKQPMLWSIARKLKNGSISERRMAAKELGKSKNRSAIPHLVAVLNDSDLELQVVVAQALTQLGWTGTDARERTLLALCNIQRVRDGNSNYLVDIQIRSATSALEAIGRDAVGPLIDVLQDRSADYYDYKKLGFYRPIAAANALSSLKDVRAVDALIGVIEDPRADASKVEAAAKALGSIQDKRALNPLVSLLNGAKTVDVKKAAIFALGELGEASVASLLKPLMNAAGESAHYREVAKKALERLNAPLDHANDPEVALACGDWDSLRKMGRKAVPTLCKYFKEDQKYSDLLGELGDPQAVDPLIRMLVHGGDSGNWRNQKLAAEALGRIGDPAAIEPMLQVLTTGNFAFELGDHLCQCIDAVLERGSANVGTETLQSIAALRGGVKASHHVDGYHERIIDCGRIADRAHQELSRR